MSASSVPSTFEWLELLESEISSWVEVLVADGANHLLQLSEMDKLVDLVELLPESLVASQQPGLGCDRVAVVLRSFYASLVSTGSSLVERLADPDKRESTRKLTARRVANSYKMVVFL